jgi:hypothetical protein
VQVLTGGGSSTVSWRQLTSVEQASSAVDDPGAMTTTGTAFDGDQFTITPAPAFASLIDGYQEGWAGWSIPLLTLYPDWAIATDRLELGLELVSFPLSTAKYGWLFGVTDTAIGTRASIANAALVHAFANSATNVNAGYLGAAGTGSSTAIATGGTVTAVRAHIAWEESRSAKLTAECSGGTGGITPDVSTLGGVIGPFGATLADWRVVIGAIHVSAVAGSPVLSARLWHRRLRTAGRPFPDVARPAKAAPGGEIVVAVIGHSIAAGYAATGASTTIPANVTVYDDGVLLATWPSASPSPNRGPLHQLAVDLLAQGYTSVRIYRRATPSIALTTIRTTNWALVKRDMMDDGGRRPDLVVEIGGENDAQLGESAGYVVLLPTFADEIISYSPGGRLITHDPPTTDLGGYPEIATVRAANLAAGDGYAVSTGVTLADTVHPDAPGADALGANIAAAYAALS